MGTPCAVCRYMDAGEREMPPNCPTLLLVEAHSDTRMRHEIALVAAGYSVIAVAACPASHEIASAAAVLADIPSFDWLHEQRLSRMPPVIALAGDVRAGVMACLCGAAAWVPSEADEGYLLDTIDGVLHLPEHARHVRPAAAIPTT